ncbi:MAG TPA: acetyltransferase [Thermohalobaculum sp.]|nr:acetyltransferase [Thermohalobaculum sp.]
MTTDGSWRVVLLGLESRYAHDVIDILSSAGIGLAACIRSDHDSEVASAFPCLAPKDGLRGAALAFVVPLLTPGRRRLRVIEAVAIGLAMPPPIAHATAVVAPGAALGDGAVLGAGAVIAANVRAGQQLMLNRAASVGHDCRLGDYVTIGPGATLCGGCVLEDGVYLGAGAVLCPHVVIGRNAVVGAGAVVTRDVEAGTVVAGNPARVLRRGVTGYREIGV